MHSKPAFLQPFAFLRGVFFLLRNEVLLNENFLMKERFEAGQLVRISCPESLSYGRIARVVRAMQCRVDVIFVDLPETLSESQQDDCCSTVFISNHLALVQDVPAAAFYLLVTVVERDGDRRYVHHCLAHGYSVEWHTTVADGVAKGWYGVGGKWDANEHVYRFSLNRFVFSEDWHKISLAEYVNLRSVLRDRTADSRA